MLRLHIKSYSYQVMFKSYSSLLAVQAHVSPFFLLYLQETLSPSSSTSSFKTQETDDHFRGYNIVSEQSTSRPGCIIELEPLKAAQHVSIALASLFYIYLVILIGIALALAFYIYLPLLLGILLAVTFHVD